MKGKLVKPDELRFAITRKCNGKCRHCYNMSGKDTDKLSTEKIIEIIKEVHSINPSLNRITLTGGEPLNEKNRVLEIASTAKSMKIRVRLVTRGWELNNALCRELKNAGITRIQIGLDSSGEFKHSDKNQIEWDTYHSWLRDDQKGFQKTVHSIKTALYEGLNVSIRYSACKSNLNDICRTYLFVSSLGVSKFKFRLLFPDGRAKNSLTKELITGEELAKAQYDLIASSKNQKTVTEVTQPCLYNLPNKIKKDSNSYAHNSYKQACSCGTVAAYIDSNGDVKYCLFDEDILGNIFDKSFIDVWNSSTAEQVRVLRCPLDRSGYSCSSFKLLYTQLDNYSGFMREYSQAVHKRQIDFKA